MTPEADGAGDSIPIDRDRLLATLADLVRIDSVNPSLVEGAAGEAEIAAYVARTLEEAGLEVRVHEAEPGRPSVVGRLRGRGGGGGSSGGGALPASGPGALPASGPGAPPASGPGAPPASGPGAPPASGPGRSLMLNAHCDTVGVDGMERPFDPEVRDGRLHGRGACDMKGSLAACIEAVRALREAGLEPGGDLLVAAVADEEYASLGSADIVPRYPVDGAIVTEPTGLDVCLAHRGFVWLEVETLGRAAHGSHYRDGIDANLRMGRVLARLERLERDLRAREGHPLLGPPSLHAALLRGGTGLSTYAARSVLEVERRTVPGETSEGVQAEVQAILDELTREDPDTFRASFRLLLAREPFETTPRATVVRAVAAAAEAVLDRPPAFTGEAPWMDSALLAAAGVDTVVIGPAGGGAHGTEEWVELDSVVALAEILARAALLYCG